LVSIIVVAYKASFRRRHLVSLQVLLEVALEGRAIVAEVAAKGSLHAGVDFW